MPRIQQPYYNLHQIQTGQYTTGNEFVLASGNVYVGSYHILPNDQRFTGFQPERGSVELFELRLNPTKDILKYNQITGNEINRYDAPVIYYPNPKLEDYKIGFIERFFIQKRTSPSNTIMEIDVDQYNKINTQNNPGINGVIFNKLRVQWKISKIPINDIEIINKMTITHNEPYFPGIVTYLNNFIEFYR